MVSRAYEEVEIYIWFSLMWTAIEILCGRGEANIRRDVSNMYALDKQHDANVFFIDQLTQCRGEMLHHGKTPNLSTDTKTLIGRLILDLVRFKLGLPFEGHARHLLNSPDWRGIKIAPRELSEASKPYNLQKTIKEHESQFDEVLENLRATKNLLPKTS